MAADAARRPLPRAHPEALPRRGRGRRVSPSAHRWRPCRAGIIGLYEYANQVFELAGGRLLLRGHNTSGKTKALELLLPFCLDGDISPKQARPVRRRSTRRCGGTSSAAPGTKSELGTSGSSSSASGRAASSSASPVGIGMRANRSLPGEVPRWYFIVRDRIVGEDLQLVRAREPIGRADLAAELGDDGEILDAAKAYRGRLNDLLFGFAGEEQYQTMLRLMRDLRRPAPLQDARPLARGGAARRRPARDRRRADAPTGRRPRADRDARAWPHAAPAMCASACVVSTSGPTAPTRVRPCASAPTRCGRRRRPSTTPPSCFGRRARSSSANRVAPSRPRPSAPPPSAPPFVSGRARRARQLGGVGLGGRGGGDRRACAPRRCERRRQRAREPRRRRQPPPASEAELIAARAARG